MDGTKKRNGKKESLVEWIVMMIVEWIEAEIFLRFSRCLFIFICILFEKADRSSRLFILFLTWQTYTKKNLSPPSLHIVLLFFSLDLVQLLLKLTRLLLSIFFSLVKLARILKKIKRKRSLSFSSSALRPETLCFLFYLCFKDQAELYVSACKKCAGNSVLFSVRKK